MHTLVAQLRALQQAVQTARQTLNLDQAAEELASLQARIAAVDFWQDQTSAQKVVKQQAALQARLKPWQDLQTDLRETLELAELDDPTVQKELETQAHALQSRFAELKKLIQFSGPHDMTDAILSIHAGAGGTDAQDWAQMLLRMYVRWAEQHDCQVETVEQSAGEEAGLKSVTLLISGPYTYGRLKGEHGVHRLVRLSPFNADNLRQTSFAKVEVLPKIEDASQLALDDKDLKIDVYRSGGHGGQSVNTTDSAVRITHLPTGLTVAIQNERSQLQNKETALTILRSKLAQLQAEQHAAHLAELKGPNQSAEWGSQIRSYVLHPYKQVKDLRTRYESSDPEAVLAGDIDGFIEAYLEADLSSK